MDALDQFIALCSRAAQQLKLQHVLVAARDPITGVCKVVMSQGSEDKLRESVAEKLGLTDMQMDGADEVDWPGS